MRLFEIMIALALISLISLTGFSSYQHWQQNKLFDSSINQFFTIVTLAKQMSILKNTTLYLCATENQETCNAQWQGDIVIFSSSDPDQIDSILMHFPALPKQIHLHLEGFRQNAPYLYFMNNGEAINAGRLYFSNDREERVFSISQTGIVHPVVSG